jgi:hypothetical protein
MMCVSHVEAPPLAGYSIGSICSSDLPDVGSSPSGGLSLPKDIQARFQRIFRLIENNGLNALVMPLARHIDGTIWEMRSRGAEWYCTGIICDSKLPEGCGAPIFLKEKSKHAFEGN